MSTDIETYQNIERNARTIALRYARVMRNPCVEDMEQAAWEAQLDALQRWDESRGIPLGAYLWRAGLYAARRVMLTSNAPVSAHHRLSVLYATQAVELVKRDDETGDEIDAVDERLTVSDCTDEVLDKATVTARVRQRVEALVGVDQADFAIGIIAREFTARDVVRDHGVDPAFVYRVTRAYRVMLEGDEVLQQLWMEDA